MILGIEQARRIREGRKTQLRLPSQGDKCELVKGKVYAIQTQRGKKANLHITVIEDPRLERLDAICLRDAQKEGFRTTQHFKAWWTTRYGGFDGRTPVWVVSFELGDTTDKPRLLAAHPGGAHGDYTTVSALALPNSAEEVSDRYQARYAKSADESRKTGLSDQRERLLAAVASIRLETARQNIGTSPARKRLKSIEHHLRAMEQEARRSA